MAPLFLYLLVFFLAPIAGMLWRSVENAELREVMPRTAAAIAAWSGEGLPDDEVFAIFADELRLTYEDKTLAVAAKRLAYDLAGARSLLFSTARALPDAPDGPWREELIGSRPGLGRARHVGGDRSARRPPSPRSTCSPRSTASSTSRARSCRCRRSRRST